MRHLALIAAVLTAAAPAAFAQTGATIIERNRVDQASPGVQAPAPGARPLRTFPHAVPAGRNFAPFVLREVRVSGSSAPAGIIGAASRPFIGRTVDAKALDQITQAVAAAYARTDIALYSVSAPDQDFAGGVLKLDAVEGHIANVAVHVTGAGRKLGLISGYANKLTAERPLRRSTLERFLSLIRDIPGLTIQAELQSTGVPGAVRLAIEGHQKTVTFGAAINDRGTAYLGRTQITLTPSFYSLLREGDRTDLTFAFPTDFHRFQYYALSQTEPLGDDGTTVQANAGYLRTRPEGPTAPGQALLQGDAVLLGMQFTRPFIRRYREQLYVTAGIDGLNSDNALLGQVLANQDSRAFRMAASYGRTLDKTAYSLSGTVSLGLDTLGARASDPAAVDLAFHKLNAKAAVDQAIGRRLVLRLRATGQYSGDRLPASELFSLGGDDFGRAFEAATLTGDSGYAGSAELAWVPAWTPALFKRSELYGFTDGGRVFINSRPGIMAARYDLASAGFGGRLAIASKMVVQLEAAKPIDDPPTNPDHGWRAVISFRSLF